MSKRAFCFQADKEWVEPAVNLTPLIDVVFVILIAFIVIAPLLELDRIELAEAGPSLEGKPHQVQEASPIAIHVREDDQVLVNGEEVALDELALLLAEEKQRHPHAQPQLFQDRNAHFGTYQAVKNAAEQAGFTQLDIILKP
jgi:biopolymer transport protein ExbD